MTDITKIAQSCASRIMDRMEMCRKDRLAILKSDIEREVEIALRELFDEMWPKYEDDDECDAPAINTDYIKEFVANFEANNALLTGRMLEQVYDEARAILLHDRETGWQHFFENYEDVMIYIKNRDDNDSP